MKQRNTVVLQIRGGAKVGAGADVEYLDRDWLLLQPATIKK